MKKYKPWPTPTIPKAPISVKTHGPSVNWTAEQWALFDAWAHSLKDYGGPQPNSTKEQSTK